KAVVFRYHGGVVRCWVETATGGKRLVLGEVRAGPGTDSGVIVWQEREGGAAQAEPGGTFSVPKWWDLGIRAKMPPGKGGSTWHASPLLDQKFTYPAPEPEAVQATAEKKPGGSGTGLGPSSGLV